MKEKEKKRMKNKEYLYPDLIDWFMLLPIEKAREVTLDALVSEADFVTNSNNSELKMRFVVQLHLLETENKDVFSHEDLLNFIHCYEEDASVRLYIINLTYKGRK